MQNGGKRVRKMDGMNEKNRWPRAIVHEQIHPQFPNRSERTLRFGITERAFLRSERRPPEQFMGMSTRNVPQWNALPR